MATLRKTRTHLVVPDVQAKPGVPLNHCEWIGKYIADKSPSVVINLGDLADMASLSSYDRGKLDFEGRRLEADVRAAHTANILLTQHLPKKTETHILYGNHEDRISRMVQDHPELSGALGLDALAYADFYQHVHPFREVVVIDGVAYSHYFYNPLNGRPYGGLIATKLKTIGVSFTQGHQQGIDYGMRTLATGGRQHGLIAGSCYLHREKYLGPQGHDHWNGVVMKYFNSPGDYDIKIVSLDSLCQRYEGMKLERFMKMKSKHIIVET